MPGHQLRCGCAPMDASKPLDSTKFDRQVTQSPDNRCAVPNASELRFRRRFTYIPDDPLLRAAEAAAERGQALSTFWRDVAAGRVPPAYYVSSRSPRWRRSELRAALVACRAPAKGTG